MIDASCGGHMVSILIFITSFSFNAFAGAGYDKLVKGLPEDVVTVIDRQIACNNWPEVVAHESSGIGEAHSEVRKPQTIGKQNDSHKCSRLEKDVKNIQSKYKGQKPVLDALHNSRSLTPQD